MQTELLAPCGTSQSLIAAISGGANAVYLGLSKFNARIKADGFNEDNITEWINYAHIYGVKVYITVNTLIKQRELAEVGQLLSLCAAAKADAFIVQDTAAIALINTYAPHVPIHASTQMGVHNAEGARLLERLGVDRVVLSREALLEDIAEIKKSTSLEVEVFVQGALCVSFSGNCYMSSFISENSGNRGKCLQPCRLKYSFCKDDRVVNEEKYLLSTADLCSLGDLKRLTALGVDSLKIEGRLKSPQYVFYTVSAYRKMLATGSVSRRDTDNMALAFNRGGYTRGYSYDNSSQLMSVSVNGNMGLSVGLIKQTEGGKVYLDRASEMQKGDGIKLLRGGKEIGGCSVGAPTVLNGKTVFSLGGKVNCKVGDEVRVTSREFRVSRPKLNATLAVKAVCGSPLSLSISGIGENDTITLYSEAVLDVAAKVENAANEERLKKALLSEDFTFDTQIDTDGKCFVPSAVINGLKKRLLDEYKAYLISGYKVTPRRNKAGIDFCVDHNKDKKLSTATGNGAFCRKTACEIANIDDLEAMEIKPSIVIYSPEDYNATASISRTLTALSKDYETFLKLPNVARGRDIAVIRTVIEAAEGIQFGIYADNLYAVELAQEYHKALFAGAMLNLFNSYAVSVFSPKYYVISAELHKYEIQEAIRGDNCFVYTFGRFPLMTLSHCQKALSSPSSCASCKCFEGYYLADRQRNFPLRRIKMAHCCFYLLNSVPHNLTNKVDIDVNYYYDLVSTADNTAENPQTARGYEYTLGAYNKFSGR